MNNLNLVKITSSFVIALSCLIFSSTSKAAPSAIDSALNSSLQETSELSGSISQSLDSQKSIDETRKAMQKNRKVVQLNMEESETDRASAQAAQPKGSENSQASGSLIESSY